MNILEQLASGLLNYSRSEPEGLLARGLRQPAGLLGRGLNNAINMPGPGLLAQQDAFFRPSVMNTPEQTRADGAAFLQNIATGPLGLAPVNWTAYHGSPHKFDKFSMDKIGTGEGAQAYGHGLYFADSPGTAAFYRDMAHPARGNDPRDEVTALRQNWQTNPNPRQLKENEVQYLMQDFPALAPLKDDPDIVKNIARVVNGLEPGGTSTTEAMFAMRALDKQLPPAPKGNFYKVDISDKLAPKEAFLQWDLPLSQQSESVKKAFEKILKSDALDADSKKLLSTIDVNSIKAKKLYELLASSDTFSGKGEFGKAASDYLKSQGIPGIRYLDAGSRANGGTYNTVLFDDSLVKILERQ